jgi:hypothetical protein
MTMIAALHEIHRILVKHNNPWQAEVVAKLIELRDSDRNEFVSRLHSGDMWGGSGSVWEVGELGSDTRSYWKAIVLLADEMEREGIGTERSQELARILRDWILRDLC